MTENKKIHNPAVSILVPVYKVENYLEECLDSLVNQTLKDIEIICVNDGSPDSSAKILEKYSKEDSRIVIVNKENGGLPSARNAGLNTARGEYVGFVDADDYAEPNMFEKLYKTAKKENSEIVVCGANIFPLNPKPSQWLYEVLSPKNVTYREFTPEIIFSEPGARPFLWRTFIKRDLIERNGMRLQEDILVGEDNAFQCRIYPMAKGVTLISDKLYNYRWYREGSMMNSGIYDDMTKRVYSHTKLLKHIAEKWLETDYMGKMEDEFLKWSVEFLYDDFIKIPLNDRIYIASEIVPVWEKCSYYKNKISMPLYIDEMFEYFISCTKERKMSPRVSVIIPVGKKAEYLKKNIIEIIEQNISDIEIILINCNVSDSTYAVMHKLFHKYKNIRMFNQGGSVLSQALNIGIKLASGKYFTFIQPKDWYSKNIFDEWYKKADSTDSDICMGIYQEAHSRHIAPAYMIPADKNAEIQYFFDTDFKNILYRTEFIRENDIKLNNYGILMGNCFLLDIYSKTKKISMCEKAVYMYRAEKNKILLNFDECEKILDGIIKMLIVSAENNDTKFHSKAVSFLNDDYIGDLIIDFIKRYYSKTPLSDIDMEPIIALWKKLLKILSLISAELLPQSTDEKYGALPKIIYSFSEVNNNFLKKT